MNKNYYSLGLMSGTSMDGVDASIIVSDGEKKLEIIENYYEKYDYEQPHKFIKNGQSYMKNTIENEEGFFHTIYAGYIF